MDSMNKNNTRKYRVMLVDDEEDVIRAIGERLDWEHLGYLVPSYAHNGIEALEMAEGDAPDVVMTDIKMPYMDGLTLSHRLKELYPNVRIIIFSGFDEFEYAKEAIKLEAQEYILKPIDAGELSQVFERIHALLDKEIDERQNVEKLTSYYMESLPLLQEDFYCSLVEGNISEKDIWKEIEDYSIDLHGPVYCLAILHTSQSSIPKGMNPMLLTLSVKKLATERLGNEWQSKFFTFLGNTCVIAQLQNENDMTEFTNSCDRFCRLAGSVCGANVTVGIGKACGHITELNESYAGAREAVSYRAIYGTGRAICINEIAPHENLDITDTMEEKLHDIFKKIKMKEEGDVKEAVLAYVLSCSGEMSSLSNHHFFVAGLLSELNRFAVNNHLTQSDVFGEDKDPIRTAQQMDPDTLPIWLSDICIRMQQLLLEKRNVTTKSFVTGAIDYVHENYSDSELSVEKICNILSVSTAYFSTVFKKETGKTFINFLTDYRMEKAVVLLTEKDEKTYVVANEVGYLDANYFSYVFKNKFGVSPSKYRTGKA